MSIEFFPGPIRLSVALVTRNRPAMLERCLASLRAQSLQPFEVVVSDDSNTALAPETRAVAERWGCRYTKGPQRGLYANRNHAALAATGTHVRTVDDDHSFPAGHLQRCAEAVEADPASIWTLGETSFIEGRYHAAAETANQLHPSGAGCAVTDEDNNWSIADGSTIYPRTIFERGLRMVDDFRYGSSYLEFGAYLYARGYRSRCLRGALVDHHADHDTLNRGTDPGVVASRLFASLCCNLYFRPNPYYTVRYLLCGVCRGGPTLRLIAMIPELMVKARRRWRNLATIDGRTVPLHATESEEAWLPPQAAVLFV